MQPNSADNKLQQIQSHLADFFTDERYLPEALKEAVDQNQIFSNPKDILPYLQSALLDDQILEVEIDDLTRVYFSRLYDDLPPLAAVDEDGVRVYVEPDYDPAEYLKEMEYIKTWPLEPGLGNLTVRHSKKVLIRLFTSAYAVELGAYFRELSEVRGTPCLCFSYPVIGRIVRGDRVFRAKVPNDYELVVKIETPLKKKILPAKVVDISAQGMAFKIDKDQLQFVPMSENKTIKIIYENHVLVKLACNIQHLSKVRGKDGTYHLCGVKFDLETRDIASEIESIVAQVQRAHLKKLSDLSAESGIKLIL